MDDLLKRIRNRLSNLVSRVLVQRVDDSKRMQVLQVDAGADETRDGIERVQQYGFTSVPLAGAEGVVLFVGGHRDHGLCLAVDDRRHRLAGLEAGEVAVYDRTGTKVVLKANGDVEVTPSSGTAKVIGTLDASVDVTTNGVSLKTHVHPGDTLATTATVGAGPAPGVISGNTGEPL